jgi:hypothetical protein
MLNKLPQYPLLGCARPEVTPKLRSFPFGRYVVFYEPTANGIDAVRLLHGQEMFRQVLMRRNKLGILVGAGSINTAVLVCFDHQCGSGSNLNPVAVGRSMYRLTAPFHGANRGSNRVQRENSL